MSIDFGAVKEIGNQILNPQGQAPSTILIGTPGYMPTEQSHGRPSFCSDIYAVGMIAIQALTGLLPTNLRKDTNNEVVWRDRAPHVSDRLADIIDKMVRHHQGDRYQSAAEVLQALSPPPPPPPPPSSWKKVIIAGIVLAVGLSAIVAYYILTRGPKYFTYENDRYGLNIDYPETWKEKAGSGSGSVSCAGYIHVSSMHPQPELSSYFRLTPERVAPLSIITQVATYLKNFNKYGLSTSAGTRTITGTHPGHYPRHSAS